MKSPVTRSRLVHSRPCWRKLRSTRASSLVETLAGFAIVLPIFLLSLDLFLVVFAYMSNSALCREAAREASIGPPGALLKGAPRERALRAINSALLPSGLFRISHLDVQEQVKLSDDADFFGGKVDGQVTVCTTAEITPLFFLSTILNRRTIEMSSRQTYPYTWTTVPEPSFAQTVLNKQEAEK